MKLIEASRQFHMIVVLRMKARGIGERTEQARHPIELGYPGNIDAGQDERWARLLQIVPLLAKGRARNRTKVPHPLSKGELIT